MRVQFLRVLGIRSREPSVLATVTTTGAAAFVRWDSTGWTCECDTEGDECDHVDVVAALLDPRVTGAQR